VKLAFQLLQDNVNQFNFGYFTSNLLIPRQNNGGIFRVCTLPQKQISRTIPGLELVENRVQFAWKRSDNPIKKDCLTHVHYFSHLYPCIFHISRTFRDVQESHYNFPGRSSPGQCNNKIQDSRIPRNRTNPVFCLMLTVGVYCFFFSTEHLVFFTEKKQHNLSRQ